MGHGRCREVTLTAPVNNGTEARIPSTVTSYYDPKKFTLQLPEMTSLGSFNVNDNYLIPKLHVLIFSEIY